MPTPSRKRPVAVNAALRWNHCQPGRVDRDGLRLGPIRKPAGSAAPPNRQASRRFPVGSFGPSGLIGGPAPGKRPGRGVGDQGPAHGRVGASPRLAAPPLEPTPLSSVIRPREAIASTAGGRHGPANRANRGLKFGGLVILSALVPTSSLSVVSRRRSFRPVRLDNAWKARRFGVSFAIRSSRPPVSWALTGASLVEPESERSVVPREKGVLAA